MGLVNDEVYMKKFLFILVQASLLFTGCREVIADGPCPGGTDFTAVAEPLGSQTRTALSGEAGIVWSKGDRLAIFRGRSDADVYQVTDASAGTGQGVFAMISGSEESGDSFPNVAFYPYMESLSCNPAGSGSSAYEIGNVVLPQTQSYAAGSFADGSFPMTAVSQTVDDHSLKFRNVMGTMKLSFKGSGTVKSVRIEGNDSEILSGPAVVTAYSDGSAPVIEMSDGSCTSVTLDCGDGVSLSDDSETSFYISLPPVRFSKGFKVTVTNSEDVDIVLNTSVSTNEILRSTILSMPCVDLDGIGGSVHLSFTESDEDIANPERGFYSARSTGYPVSKTDILAARIEKRTIFHIGHYLTDYMTSDIADSFLQRVRNEMQLLRDNGAKCVLRFSYKDSAGEDDKPWDASPEWVARHIEQLTPIFREYGDVIMCLQAGFIGVWGEWYYTDNFVFNPKTEDDHALRKEVVDALLDAMPSDRTVALRTPMFKRMMYAESYIDTLTVATAYNGSDLARLSCFNDCFGASGSDQGTFGAEETREYWRKDTRYVLMGGETCALSEYCTCSNSLQDMEDYHWTYLNNDYNQDVIGRWNSSGCIDEIKRRLGYRLSLSDLWHPSCAVAGEDFHVILKIRNTGFAAPMNGRAVELVLVDGNGVKTVFKCDDVDPRYWFAGETVTMEKTIRIPSEASGTCTLYLNLPDPKETLHDNPLFSIRLANDDIWDEDTGYNRLAVFLIDETSESLPESGTGTGENVSYGVEFDPWN